MWHFLWGQICRIRITEESDENPSSFKEGNARSLLCIGAWRQASGKNFIIYRLNELLGGGPNIPSIEGYQPQAQRQREMEWSENTFETDKILSLFKFQIANPKI